MHGKAVLITGVGDPGQLGFVLARRFLEAGARVVINYRQSRQQAEALAHELGPLAVALQADVTDAAQVQAMLREANEHLGLPVTSVVNNALADFSFDGDARPALGNIRWERFQHQIDGALKGALNTMQAALPAMREAGVGRIVNIGTNLVQNPVVPYHDYTAAKAALLAFTRTLSHELGADGITVNMVSGGLLRTTDASAATPDAVFDMIAAGTPLREVTTPAQFADAVLFFASPWSRAVTGQHLIVDGGLVKG